MHIINNKKIDCEIFSRTEVWTEDEHYTLAEAAAYLESWSGFQNLCRDKGEAAGREVLQEFISKYFKALKLWQ